MNVDRSAILIRSRGLRGYGAAIVGGFTAVWAVIAALVFRIWARPGAFALWLILIILCAMSAVALEVAFRLDYVKLADGKLSWRFRSEGKRREEPLSAVRGVERIFNGVSIQFSDGEPLLIGGVAFRHSDIDKLVGAVESSRQPNRQS